MVDVRQAQKGETVRQKEIWKLCFGDSDRYIDFYYANRYKETETVLLLVDQEIVSMLTMFPIKIAASTQQIFNSTMLYAIATHPQYQHRGFATQLMDFTNRYLKENEKVYSVLVPSEQPLFDFYRQRGYQDGFCIREVFLVREKIEVLGSSDNSPGMLSKISPEDYNMRRNKQLGGRLHVVYTDDEIAYQQQLSQMSGADIFSIEIDGVQGCASLERLSSDRIFIKELLIADQYLPFVIKNIAELLPAKEYFLRTPAFLGQQLEGNVHPFGMIKAIQETDLEIMDENLGYLGFAFD